MQQSAHTSERAIQNNVEGQTQNRQQRRVNMLEKIMESCRFLLKNYPEAQGSKSYLDSRLNKDSQELFQFGYFPGVENISVLIDLVGEETLREEGLYYLSKEIEDSLFPRRIPTSYFQDHPLILPFRNPYGKIVGIVGRTLLPDAEQKKRKLNKYKNTKFEKGNVVFGLYENKKHILEQGCVYVVEGQFDLIRAMEVGLKNIVALGTNGMNLYQFSVISRYSNNIFLLLDNDEAGQKGREQIIDKFGQFANIQNYYLPNDYKDIDEYITKMNVSDYTEIPFLVKG